MTEDQLEQQCLEWFAETGWEVAYGPDLAPDGSAPERADYRQVLLLADLEAALRRLNPQIPASAIEQAVAVVRQVSGLDTVTSNRDFHRLLLEGVPVEYKQDDRQVHDQALLIDFANVRANRLRAINQFTLDGSKQLRRPDIVCFINGLPLAVLELKSPDNNNVTIWDAFNQLQTYKDEISDLFAYNEALVISDGFNARVGSVTANPERFMPWRTINHEDDKPLLEWQLETMVRGFFKPELLLDYIRYFVIFETDNGRLIKKIAGYHQFHAVREAVRATVLAAAAPEHLKAADKRASYADRVVPGSKKAGVVWHTQGSGKSISMCCYAGKLLQQPEMNNPTLVVVTDRNDLDGQLFATFSAARELLRQEPGQDRMRVV